MWLPQYFPTLGNRELKELICTTHGHELRRGNAGGLGGAGQRGYKRGKLGKV